MSPQNTDEPSADNDGIIEQHQDHFSPKTNLLSPVVVNGIAIIVTAIWAVSFLADILVTDYAPPSSIHVAFMVILGGIFGVQIVQGRR